MSTVLLFIAAYLLLAGDPLSAIAVVLGALVLAVLRLQPGPVRQRWHEHLQREASRDD